MTVELLPPDVLSSFLNLASTILLNNREALADDPEAREAALLLNRADHGHGRTPLTH